MYLEEIPKYRDTIVQRLLKSDVITSLLGGAESHSKKPSDIVYQYLYPYDRIIDKTSKAGNYLCFDIISPRIINRTFADFRICFWIISHDRWMRTPKGLASDLLSIEVEHIMNGSRDFGLGTTELIGWDRFNPAECFHGCSLVYKTVDFNRE